MAADPSWEFHKRAKWCCREELPKIDFMDENTVEQLIFLEVKNRLRQVKLKLGHVTLNLSIIEEVSQKIIADCRRQDKQNGLFSLVL